MFRRIGTVDPAAEDRDRSPLSRQRAAMGSRIDSSCQTADNGEPRRGQFLTQLFGQQTAGLGCASGSHDRDRIVVCLVQPASHVQERGRIVNRLEARGVADVEVRHDRQPQSLERFELSIDVLLGFTIRTSLNRMRKRVAQASEVPHVIRRGSQHSLRRTEGLDEPTYSCITQPPHRPQHKPCSQRRRVQHGTPGLLCHPLVWASRRERATDSETPGDPFRGPRCHIALDAASDPHSR